MSTVEPVRVEIWVSPEQRERWKRVAREDSRSFQNWARLELDKAADRADENNDGKEPQDGQGT